MYAIKHLVNFLYKCHNYVSQMHAGTTALLYARPVASSGARSMIITNYDSYSYDYMKYFDVTDILSVRLVNLINTYQQTIIFHGYFQN